MGNRQRNNRLGGALLAVVAILGYSQLARGEAPITAHGQIVSLYDLDLSTHDGVEALYHRIDRAARAACGPPVMTGSRIPTFAWQACVDGAVKATIVKLDRPALTAYYAERVGHAADPKLAARDH